MTPERFRSIMSNPDRRSTDTIDLIGDDCRDRNSKKRKLSRQIATEHSTTGEEHHESRTASIRAFGDILPALTGSSFNNNRKSSGSQTFSMGDPTTVAGFAHYPLPPSIQSSSHYQNAHSIRDPGMPSMLSGSVNPGGPAAYGAEKLSELNPSAASGGHVHDPLQHFLHTRVSSIDGIGSSTIDTKNGNLDHRSETNIKKNSSNDIDSTNQVSTLLQQERQKQGASMLIPIPGVPNDKSPAIAPTTPFHQWGALPFHSNIGNDKELFRNLHFQQQHVRDQSNVLRKWNNSIDNNSFNNNSPSMVPFNSIPISQALVPKNLIHSANTGSQPSATNPTAENGNSWRQSRPDDNPSGNSSYAYNSDGGRSKPLFLPCDTETLSEYQCLLRRQIELFEATKDDVTSSTKGRNKPIFLGQVGVRCIHCRTIRPEHRARGATYYPATLGAMYQSGQTMAVRHLRHHCTRIPSHVRERLFMLKDAKSSAGGGKKYWSEAASVLGVYVSEEEGLKFHSPSASSRPGRGSGTKPKKAKTRGTL